jgi:glycosyltransferase involved in cell wall biosynthesis
MSASRIAFVSDAAYPFHTGGKETRLHEISKRLAQRGRDVHIYTMKWWRGPRRVCLDGVWFHAICKQRPLYRKGHRSTGQALVFGLATLRLLAAPFDALDVDHMPFFPLFTARLVCALRRKPLYATWHEVWGREYWRTYLGWLGVIGSLVERLAFRMPRVIISNSDHTTRRLERVAPTVRVETVELGVDFQRIDAVAPAAAPLSSDVMYAGRLLSHKNVDVLLEAIALASVQYPGVRCLVVGEGPERERLEMLAHRLGLTSNVHFIDFVPSHDELFALMKASRVFVLPSEREGFGAVVLEANACGLPVVTVQHPDNAARHLIRNGENGYVAQLAPEALAKAIVHCLEERTQLRATEVVETRFPGNDWSVVADRVDQILSGRAEPATAAPALGRAA